jgi:RHS repeat-associated protein
LQSAQDGSLLTGVTWSGVLSGTVLHSYNNHLRRASTSVAGSAVVWDYDKDDLLTGASGLGAAVAMARDVGNGRIASVTSGTVTETRGYDATYGELASLGFSAAATSVLRAEYTRDALGRVVGKTETGALGAHTTAYSYDLAGRLASETRDGAETRWTYDLNGNRLTENGLPWGTVDAQDRLLTSAALGASYTYTAAGNLASKTLTVGPNAGTTAYTWDRFGALRSVTLPASAGGAVVTYVTDGQGRRVARNVNGVTSRGWLYDGQLRVVAELGASGAVESRFVYASRSNVPDTMVRSASTYRFVTDSLGSVRAVVDVATGAIVQAKEYSAWGVVLSDSNPGFQPFGFAGGVTDGATGLVHFGARDYDASAARWIAKEPLRFDGALNFYVYVNGDPVNFVDPNGLNAQGAVVGGVLGFAAFGPVGALAGAFLGGFFFDIPPAGPFAPGGGGGGGGGVQGPAAPTDGDDQSPAEPSGGICGEQPKDETEAKKICKPCLCFRPTNIVKYNGISETKCAERCNLDPYKCN